MLLAQVSAHVVLSREHLTTAGSQTLNRRLYSTRAVLCYNVALKVRLEAKRFLHTTLEGAFSTLLVDTKNMLTTRFHISRDTIARVGEPTSDRRGGGTFVRR